MGAIRTQHTADYDGDGSSTEPLSDELSALADALLGQMNSVGGLCLAEDVHPYFFVDNNGSGSVCEGGEALPSNAFTGWTPALMKAAHNHQLVRKDTGAWAHNFDYAAQLLIDSIADLNGSTAPYARPSGL